MEGYLFDIKHFAVHDGPGIRTTVFIKGCPLHCIWCHNPESIGTQKQLGYLEHKCSLCGRCAAVCPTGAHTFDEKLGHRFDRAKCIGCGKCEEACHSGALTLYGRHMTLDAVISELMEDVDFYECSGGGITLSGGECLTQADFCAALLAEMKARGIHTAVDTCGYITREALEKIMPQTDLFLYDVKAFDEHVHIKCTGRSNSLILENLEFLTKSGKQVEIRIPFVPEKNSDQIDKIGAYLAQLDNITGVRVLPYHNYAATKYKSLDIENTLPERIPTDEEISCAKKQLRAYGLTVKE